MTEIVYRSLAVGGQAQYFKYVLLRRKSLSPLVPISQNYFESRLTQHSQNGLTTSYRALERMGTQCTSMCNEIASMWFPLLKIVRVSQKYNKYIYQEYRKVWWPPCAHWTHLQENIDKPAYVCERSSRCCTQKWTQDFISLKPRVHILQTSFFHICKQSWSLTAWQHTYV